MPIPSNDYDVAEAFKRIEKELIASMMKNMKRHTDWETDEGFQWEMWQALQLQALEKYRKENPEKFKEEFEEINKMIPEAIKSAREHGQMDQEIEILEAIRKGWKPPELDEQLSGRFFRLNDRKLNALIEATTGDFEKAEAAILRKANDDYRKIIFSAQVYANTGAATYEKAVDMATKDFLAAGINCIEYKNGSRHTLEDYCDMALRTAQKRAYLAGEGEKRQEWGIHTVIMNKRGEGQPCPLCLPFVGKIMIDDVYGGGSRKDGPYKLLSEAMAAGLYHPRCRDSHTAYFPDIDEEEKLTREEVKKTKEDYMVEEEANYCARQEEKYGRLAAFSLDPENQRKYAARRDAWGEKAEQLQIKMMSAKAEMDKPIDWPKGTGGRITKEAYDDLMDEGRKNDIQLSGFRFFDGNPELIKDIIASISAITADFPMLRGKKKKVMMRLSMTMDSRDFAITDGRTIRLNQAAFRSKKRLEEEYDALAADGWFVKGTDYRSIGFHEAGHVLGDLYSIDGLEIAKEITGIESTPKLIEYLRTNLSKYAAEYIDGSEIISECFASVYGSAEKNEFALKFIERYRIIIAEREG